MPRLRRGTLAKFIALGLLLQSAAPPDEEPEKPLVDLREQLTEPQREFWDSWAGTEGLVSDISVQALLCGRRGGKSTLLAYWLVDGGIKCPRGAKCVYVSITKDHARDAMWQQIKDAALLSGARHHVNEARLTIVFDGGGELLLAGSDNKKEINKFRGKALFRVAVDECGALKPSLLKYLDEDVLEPACMDHAGLRVYSGTPGLFPIGWWYELTRPDAKHETPVWRWTATRNPHIVGGAEAYFARLLRRRGWKRDHPTFVREYLGEWHLDVGELVFPFQADNRCAELPTHTKAGAFLDPTRWRHAIGIDLGFVHASAFVVITAHPGLANRVFVLESEKHTGWLAPDVKRRLRQLKAKYPQARVVADTGGYGKPIVEELNRHWGQAIEAAIKSAKLGQIAIVRGEILAGNLWLLDVSDDNGVGCNDELIAECAAMGWDPEKPGVPSELAEDHATDAMLYAYRALGHYAREDAPPPPSTAEAQALARKKKFAEFEKKNEQKRRHRRRRRSIRCRLRHLFDRLRSTMSPWSLTPGVRPSPPRQPAKALSARSGSESAPDPIKPPFWSSKLCAC